MTYILGISCYYHDSAASLLKDGKIIVAAEEERFSRKKHDNSFPQGAINYCLKEAKISIDEVSYVGFYEKPVVKFERILQNVTETFPHSFGLFYEAIPSWLNEKLKIRSKIKKDLGYEGEVIFIPHHKSHASSAFYVSPFEEAAIVTVDGVGEWTTTAIHYGQGNEIKTLMEIKFPHSLGLFYSTITSFLGFKVNNDEYKVMGLAAYGNPEYYDKLKRIIKIREDGSFKVDQKFFSYAYEKRMWSKKFEKEFGKPRRDGEKINERDENLASSLQKITEEVMLKIAKRAYNLTQSKNLCLAGGVALNAVANGKILEKSPFENIFIQPASTDAGGSLGVAFYIHHKILENSKRYKLEDVYLGPSFSEKEIKIFLEGNNIEYEKLSDSLLNEIAEQIAKNKIVGWFQGRMEFGPRALGNRSILANPCNKEMKDILNRKIKFREPFRPFAPTILYDSIEEYLENPYESPFMTITFKVKKEKQKDIPSAIHVDGTSRIQTLRKETNPLYYSLIKKFEEIKGVPLVINTSLNKRGEPIVCKPKEAFNDFENTQMDILVLGNFLIEKYH
jgi:carbamoyltransferase